MVAIVGYTYSMNWGPNLNWKEIELLAAKIAPSLEGHFVDRVIVPASRDFLRATSRANG